MSFWKRKNNKFNRLLNNTQTPKYSYSKAFGYSIICKLLISGFFNTFFRWELRSSHCQVGNDFHVRSTHARFRLALGTMKTLKLNFELVTHRQPIWARWMDAEHDNDREHHRMTIFFPLQIEQTERRKKRVLYETNYFHADAIAWARSYPTLAGYFEQFTMLNLFLP